MKKTIAIIAVIMMSLLAFNTAQADAHDDLVVAVNAANSACPQELDGGMVMKSFKIEGENLVVTFVLDCTKADLNTLKSVEAEFIGVMAESLREGDDTKELLQVCKNAETNMVIRFANKQNQFIDMELPYTMM